jgi:hypothetical protein
MSFATQADYERFIAEKILSAPMCGIEDPPELHPRLFNFQRDLTRWALMLGRCALFEDTGLGKTGQGLEFARVCSEVTEQPSVILTPLAVAGDFCKEGAKLGNDVNRVNVLLKPGVNVLNYDSLHKIDGQPVGCVVCDEGSIMKNFEGKTRNRLIERFADTQFKLILTATPAPNDYTELGNYAEFLGVMQRSVMLAQFFTHDGGDTSKWRLKRHGVKAFWKWVSSWAALVRNPRDLGYDIAGYDLPPIMYEEHEVKLTSAQKRTIQEASDKKQLGLFAEASTLIDQRAVRRISIEQRCALAASFAWEAPNEPCIFWCDLNDESTTLAKMIPGSVEVTGSMSTEEKERRLDAFTNQEPWAKHLITKPDIAGFGKNWQHCCEVVTVSPTHSFETVYQLERRCHRFGQKRTVRVRCIRTDADGRIVANFQRKREDAAKMAEEMAALSREYVIENVKGHKRATAKYEPNKAWELPTWAQ